jgi:hypothetical protein
MMNDGTVVAWGRNESNQINVPTGLSNVIALAWLALTLVAHAQEVTTLDWKLSLPANPTSLDSTSSTNPSGATVTATFRGTNNTFYPGTAPGGSNSYFGPPTGLWDVNNGDFLITLNRIAHVPIDVTLVITHFVDNLYYPGVVSFSFFSNYTDASRTVVVQQTGNMGGFWAADTYKWSQVNVGNDTPISMDIIPGSGGGGALLLDQVQLVINGDLGYPLPPVRPLLTLNQGIGLGITGSIGVTYRVDYRTSFTSGSWLPLSTNTLGLGTNIILSPPFTNGAAALYRAVWPP